MTSLRRIRSSWQSLSGRDRARVGWMLGTVGALNAAGWGIFALAILPRHFHYSGLGIGVGAALTAWTLGCRHAFDADHIAAIDNATRKLLADRQRPVGTGFFFAVGHSSIIVVAGTAITLAARPVLHAVVRPTSTFETAGGAAGTALSASFLLLIAALNLVVFVGICRLFRQLRRGTYSESELEAQLESRGLMFRFFGRWMRLVKHSWQMFFVGFVFGIGFDTATEVLLLAGTAAAATQGLPWFAVLALPLLFTGGMTLFDTFDGVLMSTAYGWAFARPVRRLFYNLTVTGLSVLVAFLIGGIEIGGLLSTELHLRGWLGSALTNFDLNTAGFIVVGVFIAVWAAAVAVWRLGRIEARWTPAVAPSPRAPVNE